MSIADSVLIEHMNIRTEPSINARPFDLMKRILKVVWMTVHVYHLG